MYLGKSKVNYTNKGTTHTSLGDNNIFWLEEAAETRPEPQMRNHSGIFRWELVGEGRNLNLARLGMKVSKLLSEFGKQNLHSNFIKPPVLDFCVV